jgi:hypothetical protein
MFQRGFAQIEQVGYNIKFNRAPCREVAIPLAKPLDPLAKDFLLGPVFIHVGSQTKEPLAKPLVLQVTGGKRMVQDPLAQRVLEAAPAASSTGSAQEA